MDKFKTKTRRLAMYLYALGFDRSSTYENDVEIWWFDNSEELKKSLDFYFETRRKTRDAKGKYEQDSDGRGTKTDC